jgi:hypothetical protein
MKKCLASFRQAREKLCARSFLCYSLLLQNQLLFPREVAQVLDEVLIS